MSDYDGDIVFSTNDPTFIKCKFYDEFNNLPITYEKTTVPKKQIKEQNLYKADLKSFDTKIGQITNYSTSFYDLLHKFDGDDSEYAQRCKTEILERLKLTRYAQGQEIDHAKGVKTDPYPKHWINYTVINEDDSDEVKEYKSFLNDICADRKPAFFQHRYYTSKSDTQNFKDSMRFHSIVKYNKCIEELDPNNDEEKIFLDEYIRNSVLIDYGSPMNQIYHYVEDNLSPLKKQSVLVNADIANLLKTNIEPLNDFEKINYIKFLSDEYYNQKERFKKGVNREYMNIDQVAKTLRDESLSHFADEEELANYVVEVCYIHRYHQSKSFAWNVFGKFLLLNLIKNTNSPIQIPLKSDDGNISYLFNKY